jgi:hypothetical protein
MLPRVAESAVPILPSRNLDETLEFYSRLGFELQGAPIEKYRYLIIGRGSIELQFWDAPEVDPLTTDASCYIRVDAQTPYTASGRESASSPTRLRVVD